MPRWTLPALLDTRDILDLFDAQSEDAAHRLLDRIIIAANRLDTFPRFGKPGPEPGLRQLVVAGTAYKIYYQLADDDQAEILRVLPSALAWPPKPRRPA